MSALLFFLLLTSPVSAGAEVTDVVAWESAGVVDVSFQLRNGVDRKALEAALATGSPVTLRYTAEVIRRRRNWFDSTISAAEIEIVATFNPITRDYLLNFRRDRKLVHSEIVATIDDVATRMTSVRADSLFRITRHPSSLRLRVRADVATRYILHLVPWDRSTGWTTARIQKRTTQ